MKKNTHLLNAKDEKVMNGTNVGKKTINKLCDWIDSNINDGYLTEDDAKVEKYEKIKTYISNLIAG